MTFNRATLLEALGEQEFADLAQRVPPTQRDLLIVFSCGPLRQPAARPETVSEANRVRIAMNLVSRKLVAKRNNPSSDRDHPLRDRHSLSRIADMRALISSAVREIFEQLVVWRTEYVAGGPLAANRIQRWSNYASPPWPRHGLPGGIGVRGGRLHRATGWPGYAP